MIMLLTDCVLVLFVLCGVSNAQVPANVMAKVVTSTVTPVRYALVLRELAEVTKGRTALQAKVQQMREAYDHLKTRTAEKKASCRCFNNTAVAFTAHLDKDITVLGKDQPIPFDNVTLNEGNAYDARHAQFRAPYNGTYQFFASLTSNTGYQLAAQFMLNDSPVINIRTGNDNQWHSATNNLAIHMNRGDDLWVQHAHSVADSNRLFHGEGFLSTFSGYLISKD